MTGIGEAIWKCQHDIISALFTFGTIMVALARCKRLADGVVSEFTTEFLVPLLLNFDSAWKTPVFHFYV